MPKPSFLSTSTNVPFGQWSRNALQGNATLNQAFSPPSLTIPFIALVSPSLSILVGNHPFNPLYFPALRAIDAIPQCPDRRLGCDSGTQCDSNEVMSLERVVGLGCRGRRIWNLCSESWIFAVVYHIGVFALGRARVGSLVLEEMVRRGRC